jgi:membrane-associated phospholipid phosphatase
VLGSLALGYWVNPAWFLVTAFVGASRIQTNEHRLSDVIAGITLGTLVGVSFAKYHKEKDAKSSLQTISLSPVYDKDLRGWVITLKFL